MAKKKLSSFFCLIVETFQNDWSIERESIKNFIEILIMFLDSVIYLLTGREYQNFVHLQLSNFWYML